MSAIDPGAGPPFDRSEDHEYFRTIERTFLELRGAPHQLSPDDYRVSKEWRAEGIPAELVIGTLREVVKRRLERGSEVKGRLAYYRRPVAEAWATRKRLRAAEMSRRGGAGSSFSAEGLDLAARLRRLAAAVPSRPWAEPTGRALAALTEAVDRQELLGAEAIEDRLGELDSELVGAAEAALDPEGREDLERRVELTLDGLRGRLGFVDEGQSRGRLRRELIRREQGVPLLSLFAPAALEPPTSPDPHAEP